MKLAMIILLTGVAALGSFRGTCAASDAQGGVPIRIDDGTNNKCIETSDRVTINLRRIVLPKESGWFTADSEVGITLTTTIAGATGGDNREVSLVKILKEPVQQFGDGPISIPIEQNVVNSFLLSETTNVYSAIEIDVAVVKEQTQTVAAQLLLGAANATKNLPIPPNPYTAGFELASTYVSSIVQPLISQAVKDGKTSNSQLALQFGTGSCTGDREKTGTKAIIFAWQNEWGPSAAPGVVDLNNLNRCFNANIKGVFELQVGDKPAAGGDACTNLVPVRNPYIGFYVNAEPIEIAHAGANFSHLNSLVQSTPLTVEKKAMFNELSAKFGSSGLEKHQAAAVAFALVSPDKASSVPIENDARKAYLQSLERCEANGVGAEHCFAP
jgi:hypothetical protein